MADDAHQPAPPQDSRWARSVRAAQHHPPDDSNLSERLAEDDRASAETER